MFGLVLFHQFHHILIMKPPTGSKGNKGRKRGVVVCPRVMTLIKKLAAYQQILGQ